MTGADPQAPPAAPLPREPAELLYEEAPCGFVSALPDGTIARVNAWVTRRLGRSREELVGRVRLQELLTIGGRIYWETHVHPLLRMQGHVDEIALELAGAGGPVPILLNALLRHGEDGEPAAMRVTLLDVTERRRYEGELLAARDEAEEAARIKETLVSMISHDLRNPLSSLFTATELLKLTALDEPQKNIVNVMQRSVRSMRDLLDAVLDVGKLESGHARLEAKPFELRQMVEDLSAELGIRAKAKGIKLVARISPDVPARLVGDSIKLGRVLSNLIGNGIKFTEAGEVRASIDVLRSDDERVTLAVEVRDTGIGIAEDEIGRIFDDFTQGNPDIHARFGGSGLGLGICKRLLALHGSQLRVSSRLGEGSTFSFALTLKRAPPNPE